MIASLLIIMAIGIATAAHWRWRNPRIVRRLLRVFATALAVILALLGGYLAWVRLRAQPLALTDTPFQGVTYQRLVLTRPRPIVAHLVIIDTQAPGISFAVTPPRPRGKFQLEAATTSDFLAASRCQIAINAAFFEPWHESGPLDYCPHRGDPVNAIGPSMSMGREYGNDRPDYRVLRFSRDNHPRIGEPDSQTFNAVPGREMLVVDGQFSERLLRLSHPEEPNPRTVVGLDRAERRLILLVIDGRQRRYSKGATLAEAAQILIDHGAWTALHLDGGGSSTLAIEGRDGRPRVLNSPIHGHMPGVERPVANHLGVFAKRL